MISEFESLLEKAFDARASDIHIQPYSHHYRVRFRIDGQLIAEDTIDLAIAQQLIARIKVLCQADVAEQRRPQDGTFTFQHCDVRVATFPSVHGEKVVLRLLSHQRIQDLSVLGMNSHMRERLIELIHQQGFFLATGPTGSGKSTTLHALLSHLSTPQVNCVTLEDPVEYVLEGVTQTQVHPEIGLTFEKGLRALLRQDPDVIMVGEIRDTETAQVALQAALTGHTVLSTLHTTDAPSTLMRLAHMGCERYLIAAGVKAIIAQRLVKKLCECKQVATNGSKGDSFYRPLSIL
jgi:type IV pilus assembly protein PilB